MRQCARCGGEFKGKRGLESHDKRCAAPEGGVVKTAISRATVTAPPIRIVYVPPSDMEGYRSAPTPAGMNYSATGTVDQTTEEYVYTVWDTHGAQVRVGNITIAPAKLPSPRRIGVVRRSAKVGSEFTPIELHDGDGMRVGDRWVQTMSVR